MNKSLKVLFLVNGIFVFGASLLGPLYAIYVSNITSDIVAVSLTVSVFLIASTIFTFLMSLWGDKVKEKEFLLIGGFLVRAVVWIGFIYATNLPFLLALQVLSGFGESLGSPAYNAIFAEHLDHHNHIKDYSLWSVLSNITGAIATFLGGLLVANYGFNIVFIMMSCFALVSAAIAIMTPRDVL